MSEKRKVKCYTNGIVTKRIPEGEPIPKGFYPGVRPMTEEEKRKKAEKTKQTNLKKYGVENPSQAESVKEKKKQTFQKKYGADSPFQSKELREKARKTNLERYGVENPSQSDEIKQKKVQTTLKNFGVEHPMQSEEVMNKSKKTVQEKYGVGHISQSKEFKEKFKQTSLEKYGVDNPAKSEKVKEKQKQTNLKKYGYESSMQSPEVQERVKQANLKKYGTEHYFQSNDFREKFKEVNLERYGVENPFQSEEVKEKIRKTHQERLGVDYPMQSDEVMQKSRETSLEKYGTEYPNQSEGVKRKIEESTYNHYGVRHPAQSDVIRKKIEKTNMERYGVSYAFLLPENRTGHASNSKPNLQFAEKLEEAEITYEREFPVKSYLYDFKVGNYLIEVNPSITHNTLFNPFGPKCIDKYYHQKKSRAAEAEGYHVIHIWDWDDTNKIIKLLQPRETIYARNCEIKTVERSEERNFLKANHLQGFCQGSSCSYGLYHNQNLVSLMSFGKPRYNKNYEYELLRYCSTHNVIGGAEKMFKHFLNDHNPESIISYCDKSKFSGGVYNDLGFIKDIRDGISRHWYSIKEKRHITDNLLRQRGYDQLFNEHYGKGTSNEGLMIDRGYLPIYDCGQSAYIWKR